MDDTNVSRAQGVPRGRSAARAPRWLLLVAQLPPKPDYLRVKLRRRVQRVGAVPLKGALYVLPYREALVEDFAWLRAELAADGGDAIVWAASAVAGVRDAELEARFRAARDADYRAITRAAGALATSPTDAAAGRELARLRRRLEEVQTVDYFDAPAGRDARRALAELARRLANPDTRAAARGGPRVHGRTWVTRRDVFVDRIASAWLIRRCIDPAATFRFVRAGTAPRAGELRFDMYQGEYTHEGDRCTFETLLARFRLDDPALSAIGEIVHDIDCKDEKFGRAECSGIAAVLAGLVRDEHDDARRIERGGAIFEALYVELGRGPKRRSDRGTRTSVRGAGRRGRRGGASRK